MLQIDCFDRWQVYFRLCELGIRCTCQSYQPLQVEVTTPQSVVQIQSVLAQVTQSRLELACWLDTCWQLTA
ncbi:MAG: Asr1405/Asl0597 family protein [Cyanobacteria bacterium J06648_16]